MYVCMLYILRLGYWNWIYLSTFCVIKITLCMPDRNFSRWQFETFFLFFLENKIWHFMQIVSLGDNLHEVSDPIFFRKQLAWSIRSYFPEKKTRQNITKLLSAESARSLVSVIKLIWLAGDSYSKPRKNCKWCIPRPVCSFRAVCSRYVVCSSLEHILQININ